MTLLRENEMIHDVSFVEIQLFILFYLSLPNFYS